MRILRRQYDSGWGELVCLATAWAIALGVIWLNSLGQPQGGSDKVAVSGARTSANPNLD